MDKNLYFCRNFGFKYFPKYIIHHEVKSIFHPPKCCKALALTAGIALSSALCCAQSVAVYGDSVSVTLAEAGTLRETLIDHDVSFNTVKRLRLAGPFNSEELKFFVEKAISGLETIDMLDAVPTPDEQSYGKVDSGGEVGATITWVFSNRHSTEYTGHVSSGLYIYIRDLYNMYTDDLSGVFSGYENLQTLILPKTTTRVGMYLASGCENLKNVVLPATVDEVGESAFYSCTSLTHITGLKPKVVEPHAFYCTQLSTFDWSRLERLVENGLYNYAGRFGQGNTFTNTQLTNADVSRLDTIPAYTFSSCKQLTDVTLSDRQTYLGAYAFKDTKIKMDSYTHMPSLTFVGKGCFDGTPFQENQFSTSPIAYLDKFALRFKHDGKTSYTIKDGTTMLCDGFSLTDSYQNTEFDMTLPSSLRYIGNEAFKRTCLATCQLPDGLEYIGEDAFEDSHLKALTLPQALKHVGRTAFTGTDVERIVIPDTDCDYGTSLYSGPFTGMEKLTKVDYNYNGPSAITFRGCDALTIVNIGANVERVPENFCYECSHLTRVTMAEHTDGTPFHIGKSAFSKCSSLSKITFPSTTDSIGWCAFYKCNIEEVNLPANVKYIDYQAFYQNPVKHLTIPESIEYIHNYAFDSDIQHITYNAINAPVFSLPKEGITSITIGPKVEYIPEKQFAYCSKLATLTFEKRDSRSAGLVIGASAFTNAGALTRLELPEGTTRLESGAFAMAPNLKIVSLPSTLTSIHYRTFGDSRFGSCGLDTVYCYIPFNEDIFDLSTARTARTTRPSRLIGEKADGSTVLCVLPQYYDDYRQSVYWGSCNCKIETMPQAMIPDGIVLPTMPDGGVPLTPDNIATIHDVTGRRLDALARGLNIVRTKDGRTVKVWRKE